MIFQNKVPKKYWGEAVLTASYLINHFPYTVIASKTPMEVLSPFYPNVSTSSNLTPRIFGCTSFIHIHSDGRGKLYPRVLKCVFIGYSSTQKGLQCYHPPSHKFFVSRDVTFHEQESYFVQTHLQGENVNKEDESLILLDLILGTESDSEKDETDERYGNNLVYTRRKTIHESTHIQESDPTLHEVNSNSSDSTSEFSHEQKLESNSTPPPLSSHYQDLHLPIALRKDTRNCTKQPLYPLSNYLSFEHVSPTNKAFLTNQNTIKLHTSLSEAFSDRKWK